MLHGGEARLALDLDNMHWRDNCEMANKWLILIRLPTPIDDANVAAEQDWPFLSRALTSAKEYAFVHTRRLGVQLPGASPLGRYS